MNLISLKFIGIGLTSIAMMGASIGIGNIFASLINGIARNPSAEEKMLKAAFIGAGLSEAMGLFGFLISLLLIFFV